MHFSIMMTLLGAILVTLVTANESESGNAMAISDNCLGCICHASTGCKKDQGCSDAGVCGPFLITQPFWIDGGKHMLKGSDPNDPEAYKNCVTDTFCASETVRAYMEKYAKDCNGDGAVTCEDYARIHKSGPNSCDSDTVTKTEFYEKFKKCSTDLNLM